MRGRFIGRFFIGAILLVAGACSGGDGQGEAVADVDRSTSGSSAPVSSTPTSRTVPVSSTSATTTGSSTVPTSQGTGPGSSSTAITPTSAPAGTSSSVGSSLVGGSEEFFTSPSGNIACHLLEGESTSCWISEKDWSIDRPADPFCEIADYGNAVEVDQDGSYWPCYTDSRWDFGAEPLGYGSSLTVGSVTCSSERTGVTCSDGSGAGFFISRADARIF